jgi:hypothetical protein
LFVVGGSGVVGLEVRTRKIAKKYKLVLYTETGYSVMTPLRFSYDSGVDGSEKIPLGTLRFGGGASRVGIGLKF